MHLVSQCIQLVLAYPPRRAQVALLFVGVRVQHHHEGLPFLLVARRFRRRPQHDGQLIEDLTMLGTRDGDLVARGGVAMFTKWFLFTYS